MKNEWQEKSIGDIIQLEYGNPLDESQRKPDGRFPVYGANGEKDRTDKFYHDKPSIIVGRKGSAGEINLTEEKFWPLDVTYFVTFDERQHDLRFLFYLLTTLELTRLAKGVKPGVNRNEVYSQVTRVPRLSEQQRIAGLLDKAFAGIATAEANAEKNLQNARSLFESHLNSVFSRRRSEWAKMPLEQVLAVQPQNGWSPPAANHSDSGTPVLTLSSVTGFLFRPDKRKFTSVSTDPRRNYWVKNGDFLITRSNTPELVGHVAIASGIHEPTIYPDLIMRMNPMPDRMMTEFLYYQMRTAALRKEITGRAQGANPTMKKISNGAVKTLPIVVPPIATQRSIVETLNALAEETQRLANLYERKCDALEALRKSLLHEAFLGNLHNSHMIEAESLDV